MNLLIRRVLPAVVSSFLLHTGAHAGFQPIALFGEEAPGTGGATFGNLLGTISVAGNGDITFWSTLNGATSDTDTAAFRVVDGVISKIIQQGDEAPGLGGPTFDSIGGPVLSDSGVYALSLRLDFGGEITFDNDWGLWADFGSGLTNIAQEGDEAPGLGGALFDRPGEVRLSTNGDIAFFSRLKDVGEVTNDNDGTLWRRVRGGDLELLAREGCAAVLSGHTHGGQIALPFLRPVWKHIGPPHPGERIQCGPTTLIVNRGLGVVAVPWRHRAPTEVVVLELAREEFANGG